MKIMDHTSVQTINSDIVKTMDCNNVSNLSTTEDPNNITVKQCKCELTDTDTKFQIDYKEYPCLKTTVGTTLKLSTTDTSTGNLPSCGVDISANYGSITGAGSACDTEAVFPSVVDTVKSDITQPECVSSKDCGLPTLTDTVKSDITQPECVSSKDCGLPTLTDTVKSDITQPECVSSKDCGIPTLTDTVKSDITQPECVSSKDCGLPTLTDTVKSDSTDKRHSGLSAESVKSESATKVYFCGTSSIKLPVQNIKREVWGDKNDQVHDNNKPLMGNSTRSNISLTELKSDGDDLMLRRLVCKVEDLTQPVLMSAGRDLTQPVLMSAGRDFTQTILTSDGEDFTKTVLTSDGKDFTQAVLTSKGDDVLTETCDSTNAEMTRIESEVEQLLEYYDQVKTVESDSEELKIKQCSNDKEKSNMEQHSNVTKEHFEQPMNINSGVRNFIIAEEDVSNKLIEDTTIMENGTKHILPQKHMTNKEKTTELPNKSGKLRTISKKMKENTIRNVKGKFQEVKHQEVSTLQGMDVYVGSNVTHIELEDVIGAKKRACRNYKCVCKSTKCLGSGNIELETMVGPVRLIVLVDKLQWTGRLSERWRVTGLSRVKMLQPTDSSEDRAKRDITNTSQNVQSCTRVDDITQTDTSMKVAMVKCHTSGSNTDTNSNTKFKNMNSHMSISQTSKMSSHMSVNRTKQGERTKPGGTIKSKKLQAHTSVEINKSEKSKTLYSHTLLERIKPMVTTTSTKDLFNPFHVVAERNRQSKDVTCSPRLSVMNKESAGNKDQIVKDGLVIWVDKFDTKGQLNRRWTISEINKIQLSQKKSGSTVENAKLPAGYEPYDKLQTAAKKLVKIGKTFRNNKSYTCTKCGHLCYTEMAFNVHISKHTGIPPFQCPICGKRYTRKHLLNICLQYHSKEFCYKCQVCAKGFPAGGLLKAHMVIHSDARPHKCDVCKKGFKNKGNMLAHKKIHVQEKHIQCSKCSLKFRRQTTLHNHFNRVHTSISDRKYKCVLCGKTFFYNSSLTKHLTQHSVEKTFPCTLCERRFKTKRSCEDHIETHKNERPYKCATCGKGFKRRGVMIIHIRSHDKPFKCPHCDRRFVRTNDVKRHKLTHLGRKDFKCSFCEMCFYEAGKRKRHEIGVHGTTYSVKCEMCGRVLKYKNHLESHMKWHAKQKVWTCKLCGERRSRKHYYEIHMRTHTGEKPYMCDKCGETFISHCWLTRHKKTKCKIKK